MEFPDRFPFDVAPFPDMECLGCGCPYLKPETPLMPEVNCMQPLCGCHETYWDSLPELEKRAMWGDK